jgi:hypothetical protein
MKRRRSATDSNILDFSSHAVRRSRQRSIKAALLDRVWSFGTAYNVGGNRIALFHGRDAAFTERREEDPRALPLNVAMIVESDRRTIVTVHRVNRLPRHWRRIR